jgi:ethanolaminephosphotransferase
MLGGVLLLFLSSLLFFIVSFTYFKRSKIHFISSEVVLNALGLGLYGASLFASSFVEEEHQYWYFIVSSLWCWHMNHR